MFGILPFAPAEASAVRSGAKLFEGLVTQ
jgi:hypothetical protein